MRLALFQPDIAQNTGTILRLAACFDWSVDIIEPCGFVFSDTKFRRAGMDYIDHVKIQRHINWNNFKDWVRDQNHRLVLVETDGAISYTQFHFQANDILVFGRESAGTPKEIYTEVDASVYIPLQPKMRSLNVALAAAITVGEAMRQIKP